MSRRSVATEVAETMKIVRVTATPLNIPLQISLPGIERKSSLEGCFVEVETDIGIVGHGLAAITRETVIAEIVNGVIAPAIMGDDPLASEAIWDKLYWTLTPRGQTGFGAQALFLLQDFGRDDVAEILQLIERADLDLARAGHRVGAALHPLDRLGHVFDLPNPVAGDQLAGLGEGPVDDGATGAVEGHPLALC